MAKARTRTKGRPRAGPPPRRAYRRPGQTGSRRPSPGPPRRPRVWWLLPVAAAAVITVVLVTRGGDTAQGGEPFVGGDLHSLVVDPADPSRLYVGGHEAVAMSTDAGRTWRQVDSLDGADAMGWAFTKDQVMVGGHPGLFVSTDGGRTFHQRNEGLPSTDIHALGSGGRVLYAASPQVGVIASSDGGTTWTVASDQVGHSFMGRILVDPADPKHLVAPDMEAGAVESTDGGRSWRVLGGVGGAMWVSGSFDDGLVVSGMDRAAVSTNGGRTWRPIAVPSGAVAVERSPTDAEVLYAAALRGSEALVWVSRDGGGTWTQL